MSWDPRETHQWPPRPAYPLPSLGSPGRVPNPGARTNTRCFPRMPPPACLHLSLLEKPYTAACVGDRLTQPSPTQGVFLGPRLWPGAGASLIHLQSNPFSPAAMLGDPSPLTF